MGEVVPLTRPKKPRNKFIRSCARECLTEAFASVKDPIGVILVAVGRNNSYAIRSTNEEDTMKLVDLYGRALAVLTNEQRLFIDSDEMDA